MIKDLIRYILFFYIFLLSGVSQLHPCAAHEQNAYFSVTNYNDLAKDVNTLTHTQAFIHNPSSSGIKKLNDKFIVEENEVQEEESISTEKQFKSSNLFVAYFQSPVYYSFLSSHTDFVKFYKLVSCYLPSRFYLIFQVFRI